MKTKTWCVTQTTPRTFSSEEMQKVNDSISLLIQATWDGDWKFDYGEPKKALEFLDSVGLAVWWK